MTIAFAEELTVPGTDTDSIPEVTDVEYPCSVCGKEAGPYGGRGRKPTKCEDHKKTKSASTGTRAPRVSGSNDMLARQATEALASINGMMAFGARIVKFTDTAETIEEQDEIFRARVYAALLNNPKTAQKIISMGGKAGDSALLIAIALHVATIAPVFMAEAKLKKAEREALKAAEEEQVS